MSSSDTSQRPSSSHSSTGSSSGGSSSALSSAERIGPFILGETLGEGATGKVKIAFHKDSKTNVAIKIINKTKLTTKPSLKKKVEKEIAAMKLLKHPNLVQLYDVLQTRKYLFLVIEYVEGGELFDYIVQHGKLSETEAFRFFKQIILGVEYCHDKLICHRDLKPENLLLDKQGNIKIADFGMASMMSEDFLVTTSCGSPHYASPEVVNGGKYNGMMADIWSCGVILYALLAGTLPFDDENVTALLAKVRKGHFTMPNHFTDDARDLISRMLSVDPKRRLPIKYIKRHAWWRRLDAQQRKQNAPTQPEPQQLIQMDVLPPEQPAPPQEDTDQTTEEEQDHSIQNINQEIMDMVAKMGWKDRTALVEALQSTSNNIETVVYRLLQERMSGNQPVEQFNINPKLKVSASNPLEDPIEPLELMKRKIQEAEEMQKKREQEKKGGLINTLMSIGKLGKKKPDAQGISFEIVTPRNEQEIISELTRAFKELKITWIQVSPSVIGATCTENADLDFNVSVRKEQSNNILKFSHTKGNPYAADAVFSVLQIELQL